MQPTKLLPDAAAGLDAECDGLDELEDGALDELEPHAAIARLAAAIAAADINAVCFTVSSTGPGCRLPRHHGTPPLAQTARKGKTC
jgi:hypothetical protein